MVLRPAIAISNKTYQKLTMLDNNLHQHRGKPLCYYSPSHSRVRGSRTPVNYPNFDKRATFGSITLSKKLKTNE